MTGYVVLAVYCLGLVITPWVIGRATDWSPRREDDVAATLGVALVWPVAAALAAVFWAVRTLMKAGER